MPQAPERPGDRGGQPVFFVPASILAMLSLLLALHLTRTLLQPDMDQFTLVMLGVVPGKYMPGVISAFPGGYWAALPALISYAFLHANFTHLAINSAWLLAFGSMVVRKIGTVRFMMLYLLCALLAAIVHILADFASLTPMVGASGAISGLMGAGFRIVLPGMMEGRGLYADQGAIPGGGAPIRLAPLTDRRFLTMSGIWMGMNIVFGLTGIRVSEQLLLIAWDAHIAGFIAGALLIGIFTRKKNVSGVTLS